MNEIDTAQSDVASAIKSLESASGGDPAPDPGTPPPTAPEATDGTPAPRDDQTPAADPDGAPEARERDDKRGPKRGPDGKFVKKDDVPDAPEDAPDDAPPAPTGEDDAEKPPKAPKEDAPDGLALDPSKPPQGWRPDAKAKWDSIPEDIRREIIRRESDSAAGVAKLRKQYEPAERLYNEVAKHAPYFQKIQQNPIEYIDQLVQTEQTLNTGNPAQRMETILNLADQYGVPMRQALDSAMGGKLNNFIQQAHQQFKSPPNLPPEIQRELQEARRFREQITNNAAQAELQAFMDTQPEYFEEVKEDMAKLLETGVCDSYKDAYETAVWRNPEIRQREIERHQAQNRQQALKQRQQAAAAVRPPSGAPLVTGADGKEPQTTEDAVRAAFVAAQGR